MVLTKITFNKEYDINTKIFSSIKNKLFGLIILNYMQGTGQ